MNYSEMILLLKHAKTVQEIDIHREEIAQIIPQVRLMFDFDQKNHAHQFDLWMHCMNTVVNLPRNLEDDMLYVAAMLHDIGKPDCQTPGKRKGDTDMHYYGHPIRSMEIVRDLVLPEMNAEGIVLSISEQRRLVYYVEHHDDRMSLDAKLLKKYMEEISYEEFKNLMLLEAADAKAHVQIPIVAERLRICEQLAGKYEGANNKAI